MILVFGAHGQLGRELATAAAAAQVPLSGLGREALDIADGEAVAKAIEQVRPSVLVNAAAYSKVDQAEREPEEAWRANATGPENLARSAADAGVPLIHISTDYVFDGTKQGAYREEDDVNPLGVYGRSKAAGEAAVRLHAPRHLILRTAWLYGRHGNNFVKTILRLATERDELRVVADQFGSPTAAAEVAQTILAIASRLNNAAYGTYHVAGGGVTSWHGFAERIVAAQAPRTGRQPRVVAIPTSDYPLPAPRPANSVLDTRRMREMFGIRLQPWEDAVGRVVADILDQGVGA